MKNRINKSKKALIAILVVVLSITLTMNVFASTSTATSKKTASPFSFDVYLNYSWWTMPPFDESNKISKWIIDNKGFKINFSWPTGNETDKLNMMIASGKLPDVIVMDRGDMEKKLVQLDKIVPLDNYIKKYSGYRSMVEKSTLNLSKINGKTYGLLNWPMNNNWLGFGSWIYLDANIYKKLGSPRLDTLKDLENYLVKVKNAKLTVNGKAVVPLQSGVGGVNDRLLWACWGNHRTDAWGMSTRPINGKLALSLTDPKYAEFVSYINELYTKGLVNSDCFIETKEQIEEKLATKRVAVFVGTDDSELTRYFNSPNNEAQKASKPLPYIMAPILRANTSVNKATVKTSGGSTLGWNTVVITKNAKDPEKIYQCLDWLASRDGQRTIIFGPKGELWDKVDKNGVPILKPGASLQQTAEQSKVMPLITFGIVGDGPFCDHGKLAINSALPKNKQDVALNYSSSVLCKLTWNATEFNDLTPASGTPEALINTDVNNYIKDARIKMIMAPTKKQALQILKDTITQCYAKGYKKVEDIANQKWKANLKSMK